MSTPAHSRYWWVMSIVFLVCVLGLLVTAIVLAVLGRWVGASLSVVTAVFAVTWPVSE
jgi:energy-converting hydrogenase Eha subunit A